MPPTSGELIARRSALGRGLVADRFADSDIAARGLRRMRELMASLGNPQLRYPAIHIAGSKGKGTTTHIAGALLSGHGLRTGLYTSPHLHTWHERIAIGDRPIAEDRFAGVLARIEREMSRLERDRSDLGNFNAFELLTAAAFLHFAESDVDFAVIEVGLGGRFDSTNLVRTAASVVTRIEREHEDVIGPGLASIAWNKAGIIRDDAPVVVARQVPEALQVVEREAASVGAPIHLEDRDWSVVETDDGITYRFGDLDLDDLSLGLPGAHNRSNAGAALCAVALAIGERSVRSAAVRETLIGIRIPGRFEKVIVGSPAMTWLLDVAHTPESISGLLDIAVRDPDLRSLVVMLALLIDKPAEAIVRTIADHTNLLVLPDVRHSRAIPAGHLAEIASQCGVQSHVTPDVNSAVAFCLGTQRPVVVTGSFTIVGQVRTALITNGNPKP